MGRHHHVYRYQSSQQPRPLVLRMLSIILLLLPSILYIVALSFTLKTIYSANYSSSILYPSAGSSTGQDIGLRYHASPFYNCNNISQADQILALSDFNETCVRRAFLGKKGMQDCLATELGGTWPDYQYCQKLVTSASLYTAGVILIGIALLFSLVYVVLDFKAANASTTGGVPSQTPRSVREEKGNVTESAETGASSSISAATLAIPMLQNLSTLLALLAVLCLLGAQMSGISATVSDRLPTASQTPAGSTAYENRWTMGPPALIYTSVAWLSGVLGVWVAGTECGIGGR